MDNFFTFLEIYWYVAAQKPHIQSIAVKSQKPRIQTRRYTKAPPSQKPRIQTYIPQKMENYRKKYSKKPRIQTYIPQKMENYRKKYGKKPRIQSICVRYHKTTYPNYKKVKNHIVDKTWFL